MATRMKMDLLTAVEQIVELAKESQLSKEFFRKADKYIKYVSNKLELTKEQSVMIALFINRSDDDRILIRELSKDVNCSTIRILRYLKDIDELEKKELIRCCRERRCSISYRVPYDVIEAFKRDEKYVPKKCTNLTCVELFGELEEIFELRNDNEITFDAMSQKIHSLLEDNSQLLFTKAIKQYGWEYMEEEMMLLLLFCHLYVNNNDNNIRFHDLDFLYDNKRTWNRVKNQLASGRHVLLIEDIIEYNNDDGMLDRESFRMTHKAKDEFFPELDLSNRTYNDQRKDIVKCEKIAEKQLFYDKNIQAQIDELSQLLDNVHYQKVHSRMKDSGFRCGFTCLFYGAPGTGKTETVLQLARLTGRDIMQVNISQIKSCWVGESEKNIKGLFDNYRELVKKSVVTPILLFNEADAIINKRMEGAQSAVNKMENSIQNIILQEMENLDGILIATTNLAGNMDKAFERRFLYKIKFERPTLEARMSIWHTMMPTLEEDVILTLATKYDFSGGQIENIARHYAINIILHGQSDNIIKTLSEYCDNEQLDTKQMQKIGF
ncbi:MAG: AAA family ATPase [Prevotella sp.]|nr:AAA family ATPase [Prevotella sp.]